jgi:hypothetical protein
LFFGFLLKVGSNIQKGNSKIQKLNGKPTQGLRGNFFSSATGGAFFLQDVTDIQESDQKAPS